MMIPPPPAPRLPDPGREYEVRYVDQLLNALRLYFVRLSGALGALLGTNGGQYLQVPNGLFFDIETQLLAGADVATPVKFRQTYLDNAIRINGGTDTQILTSIGGVYNFQFSGQLSSSNASSKVVYVWLVKNGVDVGYSTHAYTISGSDTKQEIAWSFNIDMQPEDYLELEWACADTTVSLSAQVPTTPHPGIPSAVLAVHFVSTLPTVLPTPS